METLHSAISILMTPRKRLIKNMILFLVGGTLLVAAYKWNWWHNPGKWGVSRYEAMVWLCEQPSRIDNPWNVKPEHRAEIMRHCRRHYRP